MTFVRFAEEVGAYADMVRFEVADLDLNSLDRLNVAYLLAAAADNLKRQEPEGVDPRRVAMAHVRQLGVAQAFSQTAIDRAAEVIGNL